MAGDKLAHEFEEYFGKGIGMGISCFDVSRIAFGMFLKSLEDDRTCSIKNFVTTRFAVVFFLQDTRGNRCFMEWRQDSKGCRVDMHFLSSKENSFIGALVQTIHQEFKQRSGSYIEVSNFSVRMYYGLVSILLDSPDYSGDVNEQSQFYFSKSCSFSNEKHDDCFLSWHLMDSDSEVNPELEITFHILGGHHDAMPATIKMHFEDDDKKHLKPVELPEGWVQCSSKCGLCGKRIIS